MTNAMPSLQMTIKLSYGWRPLRPPPASLGSPSQEGRDALSKRAGGTFVAKAGSKLCLRPG